MTNDANFVTNSAFQQAWVSGNRVAHAQMVKVLTNEGGAVTVQRNGAEVAMRAVVSSWGRLSTPLAAS